MKILMAVLAAFACGLGVGVAVGMKPASKAPEVVASSAQVASARPSADFAEDATMPEALAQVREKPEQHDSLRELIVLAAQPEKPVADPFSQLVDRMSMDADARAQVFEALKHETDPRKRAKLLAALGFVDTPDVVARAAEFIANSDSARRIDGYNLLRTAQLSSPDARAILLDSLDREEDETALAAAVSALSPESNPSGEDKARVVSELNELNQHSSSQVRAEVVLAMSRWNPGTQTESMIRGALTGSEEDLREAALTALAESPVRSEEMKSALVSVVNNAQLDSVTRWRALDTVGSYDLTAKERQTVALVRQSLPAPEY